MRALPALALAALALAQAHAADAQGGEDTTPTVRALDDGSGDGPAYRFDPARLRVEAGQLLVVRNEGEDVHTFTHDADPRLFHVPALEPGRTSDVTAPETPGEYPYVCVFHGGMRGTLVVEAASAEPPAPSTPLAPWLVLAALVLAAVLARRRG